MGTGVEGNQDEAKIPKASKLWTPNQKLPEATRKMAFVMFIELMKSALDRGTPIEISKVGAAYRDCVAIAREIHAVDDGDPAAG